MFSYTQLVFASVASVVLASQAVIGVTDVVRKRWDNRPIWGSVDSHRVNVPVSHVPNTRELSPEVTKVTKVNSKLKVPAQRGTNHTSRVRSDNIASSCVLLPRGIVGRKPKTLPQPNSTSNYVQANSQLHTQVSSQNSAPPTTSTPQAPSTSVATETNVQCIVQVQTPAASNAPSSAGYVVPFPNTIPHPLRASQSAPARMSRMTRPSLARRIIPTKRVLKAQDTEAEPTYTKRRRHFHPYGPLLEAITTPPRGGMEGPSIPSSLHKSPSDSILSSGSVMSLSELTRERPTKRARATSTAGHGPSSSGKPGALASVPSLGLQDVEMAALDATETPEATMPSPDLGDLDEWMHSLPPTPTLDDEMRSLFDEDVYMEEKSWDGDEVMGEVCEEDAIMRDWTDEDVVMEGVT